MTGERSKVAEANWAYLAGLIDGEGCFTIGQRKGTRHYHGKLVIGMGGDSLPEIRKRFNGIGTLYFRRPQRAGWKGTWVWSLCKSVLAPILPHLIPHLITKKAQAEAVLELYSKQSHARYGAGGADHLRPTVLRLNRKGA
jgi:intein/homing endonuclease